MITIIQSPFSKLKATYGTHIQWVKEQPKSNWVADGERKENMKGNVKSSFSIALLVMILLIAHCRATSLKSNGTRRCNGPMDECFIIDVGLEVLFDTEINLRLLQGVNETATGNTGNGNQSAVANCGRGVPYVSCLPTRNPPSNAQMGTLYKRT